MVAAEGCKWPAFDKHTEIRSYWYSTPVESLLLNAQDEEKFLKVASCPVMCW